MIKILYFLAGHSSESKNVCIWDSIFPHGKALVMAFTCHEQGASSLVFAPQHQVLISAGKKGDVCLIDVRTKTIRHKFTAHENAVKCIALDPHEDYFATGSADGDIKVSQYLNVVLVNSRFKCYFFRFGELLFPTFCYLYLVSTLEAVSSRILVLVLHSFILTRIVDCFLVVLMVA